MSRYIDSDTNPWGLATTSIWSWMRKVWKENVPTIELENTPENWIREKRDITTYWKDQYIATGITHFQFDAFLYWLQSQYDRNKVAPSAHSVSQTRTNRHGY